ncbi:MAG: glycosyltransferase family 2 protein [Thermoplasmatales archaeon]
MTKVLFFNPVSPIYFVEEVVKNFNTLNIIFYCDLNEVTQKAVGRFFQSLGVCAIVESKEEFMGAVLLCSPEDIQCLESRRFTVISDAELLTFQRGKILNSESDLWHQLGQYGELEFIEKSDRELTFCINRMLELFNFRIDKLEFTTEASSLPELYAKLEEALLTALLKRCTSVTLRAQNLGLSIEADIQRGVTKIEDVSDYVGMTATLSAIFKHESDISAFYVDHQSYVDQYPPVMETALLGFREVGQGITLGDFLRWLENCDSSNIFVIDQRTPFRFIAPNARTLPDFEIAAKLKSAVGYFYHRTRFLGCLQEEFEVLFRKKAGPLARDLVRFSPNFFVYKKRKLLEIADFLLKKQLVTSDTDIKTLCAIATALEPSPKQAEFGFRLIFRDTPQRFLIGDETFIDETLSIIEDLGLLTKEEICTNRRVFEQLYPQCVSPRQKNCGYSVVIESSVNPILSIITCLYNSFDFTVQFLKSVSDILQKIEFGLEVELVLVDNMSEDETREQILDVLNEYNLTNRTTLIFSDYNRNFAGGNNLGAEFAKGEFLLFLNNDIILIQEIFSNVIARLRQPGIGIVGGKLLYPETKTIQHAGVGFMGPGNPVHVFRHRRADDSFVNQPRDVKCVTGACLGITKDLYISLGGFDEVLVNEFEDFDLCLRVNQRGLKVVYDPKIEAYHAESKSPGRVNLLKTVRNAEYFELKWHGIVEPDIDVFLRNENVLKDQ